ncbi:secondary thiamine-phosphate synthase enzyme YjbQ, partial [Akkermansiaceae bacterium]|nr:secondary thiamine-phosphate synthase enzyme YjbQ [Akkermansiaceae bacterium]
MANHPANFSVRTSGKGTYEITRQITDVVSESGINTGTVTVFVQHTSASLVIMENADPSARTDLESFFDHLVPEDTPYFIHTYEGPDDMPSHIRMVLTRTSEVIPIIDGRMTLGTWQGLFLFEHRNDPHTRM